MIADMTDDCSRPVEPVFVIVNVLADDWCAHQHRSHWYCSKDTKCTVAGPRKLVTSEKEAANRHIVRTTASMLSIVVGHASVWASICSCSEDIILRLDGHNLQVRKLIS
jgi:hypothetical protein